MKENDLRPCEVYPGETPGTPTHWIGDDNEYIAAFSHASDAANVCRIVNAHEHLVRMCQAASKALRSYQYGNSVTELAEEIADAVDEAIKQAEAKP